MGNLQQRAIFAVRKRALETVEAQVAQFFLDPQIRHALQSVIRKLGGDA